MSELYFSIDQPPEAWVVAHGVGKNVVTREPWRRSRFSVAGVEIRGRMAWGAAEPIWARRVVYYNIAVRPLSGYVNSIVIHHTGNLRSINENDSKHRQRSGFATLGYHFVVDTSGVVFEGRPLEVMGSHAGAGVKEGILADPDWGSIGVALQGDYHHADDWLFHATAPEQQLKALERLLVALRRVFLVQKLSLHREVVRSGPPTVCPGDHLADKIKLMRSQLGF